MTLIVVVSALLLTAPAPAQTPDRTPAEAVEQINRGDVLGAIALLKEIVRAGEESGSANFYLSQIYTQMGELEAAERYLDRAMARGRERGAYSHQRGILRSREKRWREALVLFERARTVPDVDEATLWRHIGDAHAQLFEREEALEAYESSLRLRPDDVRTRLALGLFHLERNESESALKELRAAAALQPELPGLLAALGRAYRRVGDLQSAADVLRRAVESDPSDQESRYGLAHALLALGREDEGRRELEEHRRIAIRVESADRTFEEAGEKQAAGLLEEAEALFRESVELAPAYSPALYGLGAVLLDRGKPEEAARVLERASASNPLHADTYRRLGEAYFRIGDHPEALEATQRAIVLDEDDPRQRRQLEEIYAKLGAQQREETGDSR